MKFGKEAKKAIKKFMKEHPDCELEITGIECKADGEPVIIALDCPVGGCHECPDPNNPLCP